MLDKLIYVDEQATPEKLVRLAEYLHEESTIAEEEPDMDLIAPPRPGEMLTAGDSD
jgi:hypothetical protein